MMSSNGGLAGRGPDDANARRYGRLFLLICLPAMLLLCGLAGPFGTGDEPAHFLRIVALTHGSVRPVTADHDVGANPSARSAGGYIDSATKHFVEDYISGVNGNRIQTTSLKAISEHMRVHAARDEVYARHSNTAIYFPILYVGPVISTAIARWLDAPILVWMYAGRMMNVLLGSLLMYLAIVRARDAAPLLFACSAFPATLFGVASLATDALLLPAAMLFASCLARMTLGMREERRDTLTTALMMFVVGVGKVVYVPLIALAPLVTFVRDRRLSGRTRALLAAGAVTVVTWLWWMSVVSGKVFSIMSQFDVDPARQIGLLISQPSMFFSVVVADAVRMLPHLIYLAPGKVLGWGDIAIPRIVVIGCSILACLSAVIGAGGHRRPAAIYLSAIVLAAGCYLASVLALYTQFNPVGAPQVAGVQGRYLLPLMVIVFALTPRIRLPATIIGRLPIVLGAWAVITACATMFAVYQRYWP